MHEGLNVYFLAAYGLGDKAVPHRIVLRAAIEGVGDQILNPYSLNDNNWREQIRSLGLSEEAVKLDWENVREAQYAVGDFDFADPNGIVDYTTKVGYLLARGVPVLLFRQERGYYSAQSVLQAGAEVVEYRSLEDLNRIAPAELETFREQIAKPNIGSRKLAGVFEYNGLSIDFDAHRVKVDGQGVDLSNHEYGVLAALAINQGTVVSVTDAAQVMSDLGIDPSHLPGEYKVFISRLYSKLGDKQIPRRYIRNVRDMGYFMPSGEDDEGSAGLFPASNQGQRIIKNGALIVNLTRELVSIDGRYIYVPSIEYRFLAALAIRKGHLVLHPELFEMIWGEEKALDEESLRVSASRLRTRLGDAGVTDHQNKYVRNVKGMGYIMPDHEKGGLVEANNLYDFLQPPY